MIKLIITIAAILVLGSSAYALGVQHGFKFGHQVGSNERISGGISFEPMTRTWLLMHKGEWRPITGKIV